MNNTTQSTPTRDWEKIFKRGYIAIGVLASVLGCVKGYTDVPYTIPQVVKAVQPQTGPQ